VNAIQRTEDGFQTTGTYTDAVGQVSVELDPREGLTLTVADARFPKLEVSYSSEELTPNARIEIPLQGAPIDPATLVVHLDGNRSAPPPDMLVTFHLYDKVKLTEKELDQVRQNSIEGGSGGSRSFVWLRPSGALPNLTEAEGQWAISALPPSKYLVRIAPRSSDSGPPCMLLGEVFEVDLQAGASVEHTWQAKEGGVLRLNLSAITDLQRARIVDSTGNPVAAQFSRERSTPGSHSSSSMVQEPCTYDVQSALAAGDYGLSIVSRDGSKRIVAFHIEAGKVNDVVVTPGDL
jgi:hypothetical protein